MLAWTIYLSFIGAAVLLVLKPGDNRSERMVAMLAATGGLLVALVGAMNYTVGGGLTTVTDLSWIPQLGIRYQLAVDGISITLLVLTGIASVAGVLFSWNIEHRTK